MGWLKNITAGCNSMSGLIAAGEQILAFCIYLRLWFFNQ
jgi:hypothetical protein